MAQTHASDLSASGHEVATHAIAQSEARYLRWPRFSRSGTGWNLHLLAWQPAEGEATLTVALDASGCRTGEEPRVGPLTPSIMGWAPGRPPVPSDDRRAVSEVAEDLGWSVEITRAGYRSTVTATDPSGERHVLWSALATATAPTLSVRSKTEAAFAFHHNLREDTGTPDLAKWIAVRFVDLAGDRCRVMEPAATMAGRDRDLAGEEQSFEFPSLVWTQSGSLVLFGRGSQCIYRQVLDASGWHEREPLDDGSWGCRGMHLDAVELDDGRVLAAWRGRHAVEWRVFPAHDGGAPATVSVSLDSVRVDDGEDAPRQCLKASRTKSDPAQQHGRVTLFGDIQQHSAHSDGLGAADEPYLRARYQYGDDFCALTDHESFLGKRTSPGEWAFLQAVAEYWNQEPAFVTLFAYEWTGKRYPGPGHKCVYLAESGVPIVSRDAVPEGRELVKQIAAQGAITGPHHTGWTGADIPGHDPVGQPFWEICSCHGCYEHPGHSLGQRGDLHDQCVDAALGQGLRFGFIANSDAHGLLWHHGECRKRDPFRTGLTAVQAAGRSRGEVFEALRSRRCYATSGAHIFLDVVVDGEPMGSELSHRPWFDLEVEVVGTGAVRAVELVGPNGVLGRLSGAGKTCVSWKDRFAAAAYAYVRITQEDGEMAWSSPVFFGELGALPT